MIDAEEVQERTGGARIRIYEDQERDNLPSMQLLGRSKYRKRVRMERVLIEFLNDLQNKLLDYSPEDELQVFCEHQRDLVLWCAHPRLGTTS